ncbi:MAG: hypothetical protein JXR26_06920 [Balneolaceae bacterium]|nr:hypothetical protein [Balneolaceae bacterium]
MFNRFLNVFSTGWSTWQLAANPLQFFISLVMIMLAPYFIYLFWGSIIAIFISGGLIGWLLYRFIRKRQTA